MNREAPPFERDTVEIHIRPLSANRHVIHDIWRYRELLYYFTWKEFTVRYRQTILGIIWTLVQPTLLAFIFLTVFSTGFNTGPGGWKGLTFYFSGMMVWQLFSQTVHQASQAVVHQSAIVKKVYFPRILLPLSASILSAIDFCMHCLLFLLLIMLEGPAAIEYVTVCGMLFLAFVTTVPLAIGIGCLLASLNVTYRDVRYALPFLMQCLFFATPVWFDATAMSHGALHTFFKYNPLNTAIQSVRFGAGASPGYLTAETEWIVLCISIAVCVAGIHIFRKTEHAFADTL